MLRGDLKMKVKQFTTRVERTDVMTDEMCDLDKRLDALKQVYIISAKKIGASLHSGAGESDEKRRKKITEYALSNTFHDLASSAPPDTATCFVLSKCSEAFGNITEDVVSYQRMVDERVLATLSSLTERELVDIERKKKELKELGAKMDAAKSRYAMLFKQATAQQMSQQSAAYANAVQPGVDASVSMSASLSESSSTAANVPTPAIAHGFNLGDDVREAQREAAEAEERMEKCREELVQAMRKFCKSEAEHANNLVQLLAAQLELHRSCAERLETVIPQCTRTIQELTPRPVFGVALDKHLEQTGRRIAIVIDEAYRFICKYGLNEEGLFRLAASQVKLKRLKSFYDYGRSLEQDRSFEDDVHVIGGTMKQYLRELPEPLLSYALYDDWVRGASLDDRERVALYRDCVRRLPGCNRENLERLVHLLLRVVQHRDRNKMTEQNLGICVGPNLLWAEPSRGTPDSETQVAQASLIVQVCPVIVETLIRHFERIFDQSPAAMSSSEQRSLDDSVSELGSTAPLEPRSASAAQAQPQAQPQPQPQPQLQAQPQQPQAQVQRTVQQRRSPSLNPNRPLNTDAERQRITVQPPLLQSAVYTNSTPVSATHNPFSSWDKQQSFSVNNAQTHVPDQIATAVLVNFDYSTSASTGYQFTHSGSSGLGHQTPLNSAAPSGQPSQSATQPPRWAAPSNAVQRPMRPAEPPRQTPSANSNYNYAYTHSTSEGNSSAPEVATLSDNATTTSSGDSFSQSQDVVDGIKTDTAWSPNKQMASRNMPSAPPGRLGSVGSSKVQENLPWPNRSGELSQSNAAFPTSSNSNSANLASGWSASRVNYAAVSDPSQTVPYPGALGAWPSQPPAPPARQSANANANVPNYRRG